MLIFTNMKKALLTTVLFLLSISGFAQQCLFEKTYNDYIYDAMYAFPSEVVALEDGWLIVGYKNTCSEAYAMYIDCTGELVWEYFAEASYSTYTDLQKIDTLVYVSGVDLGGDDTPGPWQNGFIDVFSSSGFEYRMLRDTLYLGGFGSLFINSSLIVASASTVDMSGIGYSVPLDLPFDFVNIYDPVNPTVAYVSIPLAGVKQVFVLDTTVVALTYHQLLGYNTSGQLVSSSISTTIDSQAVAKQHQDTLLAVASNAGFYIMGSNFQPISSTMLNGVLDAIIDFQFHNSKWHFLAKKGQRYLVASYDDGLAGISFVDSLTIDIGCAVPTDIAVTDSTILVVGYEKLDENYRVFTKSFSHTGNDYSPDGMLDLLSTNFSVDTITSTQTISIGPTPIVVYSVGITAKVAVINTGSDTVNSFCIYSDVIDFMNCSRGYLLKCFDSLSLGIGDTIQVEWFYGDYIKSGNIARNFWIVGINDGLVKNSCDTFVTLETFFVSTDEIALAESISVHPNPFSSQVSFTSLPYNATVGIYSLQGQELINVADTDVVDLGYLSAGMYLYRILSDEGHLIKTGKLVKE